MVRSVRYSVDSTHTQTWLPEIGKLIVNFGAIEAHTYWWIAALSGDVSKAREVLKKGILFARRVDMVEKLLKSPKWDPIRTDAIEIWEKARDLSRIRNGIAHSPLVFHVPENGETADWVGIPDFGRLRKVESESQSIINSQELKEAINEAATTAQDLWGLLEQIDRIADDA